MSMIFGRGSSRWVDTRTSGPALLRLMNQRKLGKLETVPRSPPSRGITEDLDPPLTYGPIS